MPTNYWFTSDTHYYHSAIIRYCKRPQYNPADYDEEQRWISKEVSAQRVEAMNEMLIENHNKVVKPGDNVYHLGDFCFRRDTTSIRNRLNGNIHLVLGNHDDAKGLFKPGQPTGFVWVKPYYKLKLDGLKLILCHFPFARWDCAHHGSFHLHGHSHGSYKSETGKILDVGVDCQGQYRPWNFEEIKQYMSTRSNEVHHGEDDESSDTKM